MGLEVSLGLAMSGLAVTQKGLDVTSRNITNANTPHYTRKLLRQETFVSGGQFLGVRAAGIERQVDLRLQREVYERNGALARLDVKEQYLNKIEGTYGKPDGETSIANRLQKLNDKFLALVDTPESTNLQRAVIEDAAELAGELNRLSRMITDLRNQAHRDITDSLKTLNQHLSTIDKANKTIRQATGLGQSDPELEDKRDIALNAVIEMVGGSFFRTGDGAVAVVDGSGRPLVETVAEELSTGTGVFSATSYYLSGDPGSDARLAITDKSGADITSGIKGGHIGGLLELRDQTLPKFQAQLDEFAQKLALTFSNAGVRLFADSDGTIPGIVPAGNPVGFSERIKVPDMVRDNPRVLRDGTGWDTLDPDAGIFDPTDPEVPLGGPPPQMPTTSDPRVIHRVLNQIFGAGGSAIVFNDTGLGPAGNLRSDLPARTSLKDFATELVTFQTGERARVTSSMQETKTIRDHFEQRLSDKSGVNIDEELAVMIQLQRSYASAAKVISTNQQLFDSLIQIVR